MSDKHIMLTGVRVSFPHLFEKPVINGEEGKCGAVFMLEPKKHAAQIKKIEAGISRLTADKFKGKKLPSEKLCLRDGEDKGRPEYEGYMVVSANSKGRPVVLAGDGVSVITSAEDCNIYAGCYVNAKIDLWAQANQYGKRINASLVAIQFAADGDSLDDSFVSTEQAAEGFDAVDEEDFLAA